MRATKPRPDQTRPRLTRALGAVVAGSLVCTLAATSSTAAPGERRSDEGDRGDRGSVLGHPGQTSDGKPGLPVGPPVAGAFRGSRASNDVTYQIAPGITVREWDQVDGRQPVGQARMNLLTVDLNSPNITFEYLAPKYVPNRKTVSQLGRWSNAIGAVNGDFFDISDTGAPLGVGVSSTRGLLNGGREGWIPENMSLWFDGLGPHVGPLSIQYQVRQRRAWTVSGVNQPTVPSGEVGIYTQDWGRTPGYSVTEGKRRAREVLVRNNRVVANRYKLSEGKKILGRDRVLIGVGSMADKLKTLRIGKKITVAKRVEGGAPTTAITGDRPILLNRVPMVINDHLAHPRTAVGVDVDGRKLLILVVDGRSLNSRGYTMVELANMMTALGAEDALNLDGGGSSAMYTRTASGAMGIVNEPSDGTERLVPNGFGVVYHGELPPVVPITPTPTPTPTPTTAPTTPPPA